MNSSWCPLHYLLDYFVQSTNNFSQKNSSSLRDSNRKNYLLWFNLGRNLCKSFGRQSKMFLWKNRVLFPFFGPKKMSRCFAPQKDNFSFPAKVTVARFGCLILKHLTLNIRCNCQHFCFQHSFVHNGSLSCVVVCDSAPNTSLFAGYPP